MYTSVRRCTAGLAVASAGILTLSLVTAPVSTGAARIADTRTEVHAVQLAAATAADVFSSAVVNTAAGAASSVVSPGAPTTAVVSAATVTDDLETAATNVLTVLIFPLWILAAPITLPFALAVSIPATTPGLRLVLWPFLGFLLANSLASALVKPLFDFVRALLPGAAAQPTSTAGTTAAQANAKENVTGSAAPARAHSGRNLVNDVRRPNPLANTVTDKTAAATAGNSGHTPSAAGVGETNSGPDQGVASGKKPAGNSAAAHSARSIKK
jgi:hypothetical protein